ncbi:hypothetical protein COCSUDRAFT_54440 [Coccomyxa subellipsoidea C-169]|uniref:Uncharacterized protein n=1 Tax=Coccomyxa subellipsoidea (strain C-169) TaxID=574566 RepID=I0YPC2_COCSC|nr:hypothetical protein COCSUDRAFT_54440 [Coccomyxa subellipsoidea C-169]EIE20241.1 hypothetical protein COCSUDRAFT_54440 [Coccomyxa subellipsoidea C-169]|eukprot:XP_005644785.1 hypothetical protein COCSUDRAFT_54440 [Coccomyxa subellipsoidea C-169]
MEIATIVWLQGAWQSCDAAEIAEKYVPGPVEVGPEIWVGTIAACVPFVIGSWEFGKRIIIQRRCSRCQGSGLVMRGQFARKCPDCGGFFPWQGWWKFFTSTAAPGNGGPLRAPKGQSSVFYKVPSKRENGEASTNGLENGSENSSDLDDASVRVTPKSTEERV